MSIKSTQRCWGLAVVSLLIAVSTARVRAAEPSRVPVDLNRIQGVLSVVSGDPAPWESRADVEKFFLLADNQITSEVFLDEDLVRTAGGADNLDGRRVELVIESYPDVFGDQLFKRIPVARSIQILSDGTRSKAAKAVSGSKPWGVDLVQVL